MSSDIQISVDYSPVNKRDVFTSGDYISGKITLELAKECKAESIIVRLKGKAEVEWTEFYGRIVMVYHKKEKYFSIQKAIFQENQGTHIIGPGCHVYPFTFQIPAENLPSSFKSSHGKIKYSLEAILGRSMRVDSKAKAEFPLIYKGDLNSDPALMAPQEQAFEEKMMVFTFGSVGMHVKVARTAFYQGEGVQVVAAIQNKSSREVKPKFCLYRKCSYFATGQRKVETKDILKEEGDPIPASASQTVTRTITIPPDTPVSILNCQILKVEYRLKISLDVKYAVDPKLKFPIIILPVLPQLKEEEEHPAYSAYGFGAFANSDMPGGNSFLHVPPSTGPSDPPPSYGTYDMYPTLANFDGKS